MSAGGESLGKAVLELGADLSGLRRELGHAKDEAGKSAQGIGQKFKAGMKRAMVPAIAVLGAVGLKAKESVDAASDLSEQINKTSVVFGDSAKDIHAWSTGTAKSFGISQRAALEAAGVFGNMLVPMGFARKDAAKMSKSLVELSADMASFNNADPSEVMDALRAGLSGETEPLRRFGVFLNQARIEQVALNKGLWDGKGKIDAHAKAAATMAVILKDTKDAQGDFGNTAESAANQERIQAAQTEDLNAKIGKGLLPVYQQLQRVLLAVTGFLGEHTGAVKIAVTVIAALAAGVLAVNAGMKLYSAGAAVVTAAQWAWNTALLGFPLVWVVAAIAAVIAIVVLAIKHWDKIKAATKATWNAIKSWTVGAWNAVKNAIKNAVEAVKSWVSGAWNSVKSWTSNAWNNVKSTVSGAWRAVKSTVSNGVSDVVGFVRSLPGRAVGALGSLANRLAGVARNAWGAFRRAEWDVINTVLDTIRSLPGRIRSALGDVGSLLYGAGKAIITGLINGILSQLASLYSKVSSIAGKIKSLKGPLPKDRVLLVEEGQAIIEGLGKGIDDEFRRLQTDVAGYAPTIQATFAGSMAGGSQAGPPSKGDGPLVNIENMEVRDAFDEAKLASDLAWRLQTA